MPEDPIPILARRRSMVAVALAALDHAHEIIDLLSEAADYESAVTKLQARFSVDRLHAEHIMDMQFRRIIPDLRSHLRDELQSIDSQISRGGRG